MISSWIARHARKKRWLATISSVLRIVNWGLAYALVAKDLHDKRFS
jgi:hypothetical protein